MIEEIKKEKHVIQINVPATKNSLIVRAQESVNSNEEIRALWECINVNALQRLKMTDHGPVHFQIVANIALKLSRLLEQSEIPLSIEGDHELSRNHGELVIFMASLFHDLGMTINRKNHEEFSLILANDLLKQVLDFLPIRERTTVISDTLHAIISHRKGGTPYTLEAGIVRVADALDMTAGRSRTSMDSGFMDMHSISHSSIEKIELKKGETKPIQIDISMHNSAGYFQVIELLKEKIEGSGLEKYVSVRAYIASEAGSETNIVKEFFID